MTISPQRCFVSPCSAIFLPAGKTSKAKHPDPLSNTKEALLQMSAPHHGQKLWQMQPCCSLTTQRSGPNVSVGTSIDWKIISLTTRVRPILHWLITPSPGVQQEAIRQSLGALSTFHALGSLGNNLINLPPCHMTTNCILPVQIANFCGRCLKLLSVVDFLWSRLAVNHFL